MKAPRLMVFACAAALLSGCYEDGAALSSQVAHTRSARVAYVGKSLANYALMNAQGRAAAGQIVPASGGVAAASMVCPLYDGTKDAYFLAWLTDPEGMERGAIAAAAASAIGPEMVGQIHGGKLYGGNRLQVSAPGCDLPALEDGAPVIILKIKWTGGPLPATSREEMRSRSCPEGFSGAIIERRVVEFTGDGRTQAGPWETADMSGCREASALVVSIVDGEASGDWTTPRATALDGALEDSAPRSCREVAILHEKGGAAVSRKMITTCNGVDLGPRLAEPGEEGFREREYSASALGDCPESAIVLPPMSTKAEYRAALAPYEMALLTLAASCSVTITSEAAWPLWATFNLEQAYAFRGITREYRTPLPMKWEGRGGDAVFNFTSRSPWTGVTYRSLEAVPEWFSTDSTHWLYLAMASDWKSGTVLTMDGRGYPPFIGANTAPAAYRLTRFPIPYKNPGADPWGNTPDQEARAHGFSYRAFSKRRFHLEGTFTVPEDHGV